MTRSGRRPRDVIYFLKAITKNFQISISKAYFIKVNHQSDKGENLYEETPGSESSSSSGESGETSEAGEASEGEAGQGGNFN